MQASESCKACERGIPNSNLKAHERLYKLTVGQQSALKANPSAI